MSLVLLTAGRGGREHRPGPLGRHGSRRIGVAVGVGGAAAVFLVGCGGAAGAPHAGHYAVAEARSTLPAVPTATADRRQAVPAGDAVQVRIPGLDAEVTATGPDITLPSLAPGQPITSIQSAPGVLTVTVTATDGAVQVPATAFGVQDDLHDPVAFTPDQPSVTATPGHPATLHLASTFAPGETTLNLQPAGSGQPVVTWDFTVEID